MAQPLQNISIAAPGFLGLNTEDSPLEQPQAFANIADNAVIDQYGRVGARKGYVYDTTNSTALGAARGVTALYEFTSVAGVTVFLSAGNNLILSGDVTLVDETGAAAITDDDWKIVELNDIYWSDLLQGFAWSGGTAGSIDVTKHWPAGADNIVALVEHNNRLVVFGERSILIYSGIDSPSTMKLEDTVDNTGCAARDSIQIVKKDLVFLSYSGLDSLARALESENSPVGGIANNVRTELVAATGAETSPIKSVYSPEEQFYLITFPLSNVTYCFDMRRALEDGSYRATTWSTFDIMSFHRCTSVTNKGQLRIGLVSGIATYTGYNDNATATYVLNYLSNPMDFDNPSNLKFLKKIVITVLGQGGSSITLKWSYDYGSTSSTQILTLTSLTIAEFGVGEFGLSEFTAGIALNKTRNNADGSGINVSVGFEAVINGSQLSLQQLDMHALIGRIY